MIPEFLKIGNTQVSTGIRIEYLHKITEENQMQQMKKTSEAIGLQKYEYQLRDALDLVKRSPGLVT